MGEVDYQAKFKEAEARCRYLNTQFISQGVRIEILGAQNFALRLQARKLAHVLKLCIDVPGIFANTQGQAALDEYMHHFGENDAIVL